MRRPPLRTCFSLILLAQVLLLLYSLFLHSYPSTSTVSLPHNVVFVKTHKTGSSTLSQIVHRYGLNRNLYFATYPGRALIGDRINVTKLIPLPPDVPFYNIVSQHFVYDRPTIAQLFGPQYTLITILRDPVDRFISGMNFIGWPKRLKLDPDASPDAKVKRLFAKLEASTVFTKWFRDQYTIVIDTMSSLLGSVNFMKEHAGGDDAVEAFIATVDREFDLVILQEHFDEGLLELGGMLGMGERELVYVRENCKGNCTKGERYSSSLSEESKRLIQQLNPVDTKLYQHFLTKHTLKPHSRSQLASFQAALDRAFTECLCGTNTWGLFGTVSYDLCPGKVADRYCRELVTDSLALSYIVSQRQSKAVGLQMELKNFDVDMNKRHFLTADDFL